MVEYHVAKQLTAIEARVRNHAWMSFPPVAGLRDRDLSTQIPAFPLGFLPSFVTMLCLSQSCIIISSRTLGKDLIG